VDVEGFEERVEERLEERGLVDAEGDGLYDRYLMALGLMILVIIAFAFTSDGDIGKLTSIVLEAITLLVILRSSRVHRRLLIAVTVVVGLAIAAVVISMLVGDTAGERGPLIVGSLLALIGPPAIIHRLLTHHRIDLTTVAGALCVYLLAGLFFSYVFGIVGEFDAPFFAQENSPTGVDYVYFSFVTLATLGYGDLTPIGDLGRMLAVTEAVAGQLYLVSAVALLVANLGRTRTEATPPSNRSPRRSRRASRDS
jgi:Ion channel